MAGKKSESAKARETRHSMPSYSTVKPRQGECRPPHAKSTKQAVRGSIEQQFDVVWTLLSAVPRSLTWTSTYRVHTSTRSCSTCTTCR